MAKQLTPQELQKIKDSVIASCISKGIKPMISAPYEPISFVPNPQYASCVQLGYADAIKHAEQGKLGLWFSKVNSFVQSQGGVTGLLQSVSSIASQYRGNTPNPPADIYAGQQSTQFPPGYDQTGTDTSGKSDNMGLWIVLIILLIVLIIATAIYFSKKSKSVAV
jgi:hypothetical protein